MPEAPIAKAPRTRWGFKTRSLSALVLAVPVVACVVAGSPFMEALVLVAGVILLWEWFRLCLPAFPYGAFVALSLCMAAAIVAAGLSYPVAGAAVLMVAAGLAFLVSRGEPWLSVGPLYVGLPGLSVVWLRNDPEWGLATVLWIFGLVWATDIGGYLFGRLIGGWKLAPRLSPNKTWSGFCGATVCAGVVGAITALVVRTGSVTALIVASATIAVAAQGGDLFESWVKRRFGVKDSSGLIPGHGGLLDRVDGLLAAVTVAALIAIIGNGSILGWI